VARALLYSLRGSATAPRHAQAFGELDVEQRVRCLLDDSARGEQPRTPLLLAIALLALLCAASGAGAIHHGVEILLGLLSF
jgi:hypothetical protein